MPFDIRHHDYVNKRILNKKVTNYLFDALFKFVVKCLIITLAFIFNFLKNRVEIARQTGHGT